MGSAKKKSLDELKVGGDTAKAAAYATLAVAEALDRLKEPTDVHAALREPDATLVPRAKRGIPDNPPDKDAQEDKLTQTLRELAYYAKGPHAGACGIDACVGCIIEWLAGEALVLAADRKVKDAGGDAE